MPPKRKVAKAKGAGANARQPTRRKVATPAPIQGERQNNSLSDATSGLSSRTATPGIPDLTGSGIPTVANDHGSVISINDVRRISEPLCAI